MSLLFGLVGVFSLSPLPLPITVRCDSSISFSSSYGTCLETIASAASSIFWNQISILFCIPQNTIITWRWVVRMLRIYLSFITQLLYLVPDPYSSATHIPQTFIFFWKNPFFLSFNFLFFSFYCKPSSTLQNKKNLPIWMFVVVSTSSKQERQDCKW